MKNDNVVYLKTLINVIFKIKMSQFKRKAVTIDEKLWEIVNNRKKSVIQLA